MSLHDADARKTLRSFVAWLKSCKDLDSPLGDLACDIGNDLRTLRPEDRPRSIEQLCERIAWRGCIEAKVELRRALRLWRATLRRSHGVEAPR
jgi:hypothetical protein